MKLGKRQKAAGNSGKRKRFFIALCAMLFAFGGSLEAQQPNGIPRIGYLTIGSPSFTPARVDAFREGLRELGYEEGKNLAVYLRYANGNPKRQVELARELVGHKVDVIVTAGPADTRAARQATSSIPIVMAQDTDPVGNGFAASLARPGGNITGLATLSPEIGGKQLEFLKAIVPRLSFVAVLATSKIPGNAQAFRETELAAGALGVKLQNIDVPEAADIEKAFEKASRQRAEALLVLGSPVLNSNRKLLIGLAEKYRLPATYTRPEFVDDGGLMTYGASYNDLSRRAAIYVDKILKGAKPADLPIEQPTKFELVINLKTAKQIGLTIPPNVLARADRVIR